jgi:hypothetical protein
MIDRVAQATGRTSETARNNALDEPSSADSLSLISKARCRSKFMLERADSTLNALKDRLDIC